MPTTMTHRGAWLRGGLIVALAALGFFTPAATEIHMISAKTGVVLGTVAALLAATRAFIDQSLGDAKKTDAAQGVGGG